MYRASNLHSIFHKTNNSQQGQDVVATPRTTTLIYTPRVQAETDVDGLKMEICGEKIRWEKTFPVGPYLFRIDGWCFFLRLWLVHLTKLGLIVLKMNAVTPPRTTHKWLFQDSV